MYVNGVIRQLVQSRASAGPLAVWLVGAWLVGAWLIGACWTVTAAQATPSDAGVPRKEQLKPAPQGVEPPSDVDPMTLARYVDRVGDARALALLAPDQTAHHRYLGALCAPWLRAPERALAPLLRIAEGSDPDVAPIAARALRAISERLSPDQVALAEGDLQAIRSALSGLRRLASAKRVRPDIRQHAGASAQTLSGLVPAPVDDSDRGDDPRATEASHAAAPEARRAHDPPSAP